MILDLKNIKTISLPKDKTKLVVRDPTCSGLYFEVRKKTRTFIFRKMVRGKVIHKKLGSFPAMTLQTARTKSEELNQFYSERKIGSRSAGQEVTLDCFFATHYLPISKRIHKTTSQRSSAYHAYISPTFGNFEFAEITKADVQTWKDGLILSKLAPATINRILVLFSQILQFARDYEVHDVPTRDALNLSLLKVSNNREVYLTRDDLNALIDACGQSTNRDLKDIIQVLVLTGARKREVLNAEWAHLNFERQTLWLPDTKNGQPRNLSLCKDVLTLLEKRKALRFTSKYIFANPKTHKPYGCIFHAWDIARKQAGFPNLRIHDLRHSFASALVNQGVSLYEVQYLLGHNSIRSTQRYSHLDNQRLLKSVEHVSKYFS